MDAPPHEVSGTDLEVSPNQDSMYHTAPITPKENAFFYSVLREMASTTDNLKPASTSGHSRRSYQLSDLSMSKSRHEPIPSPPSLAWARRTDGSPPGAEELILNANAVGPFGSTVVSRLLVERERAHNDALARRIALGEKGYEELKGAYAELEKGESRRALVRCGKGDTDRLTPAKSTTLCRLGWISWARGRGAR